MAFIEINQASKGYTTGGSCISVLKDINLSINEGEFVAIVGYSGAGKTTLISLLAGLIRPDTGTVTFADKLVTEPGPERGLVFQNYSLLPWLTVYENVYMAVNQVFKNLTAEEKEAQTKKYIKMVNLLPARDKKPKELSGGMRQRVSVARALAMEPQVLLLDEPLGALDALTRAVLQEEIGKICQEAGKTVILITNDVDEGILLADRIIPLSAGPNATLGPSIAIDIERPRHHKTIEHHPHYKKIKLSILDYLITSHAGQKQLVTHKLHLPNIEPENLNSSTFLDRLLSTRPPKRRNELKEEKVEVHS